MFYKPKFSQILWLCKRQRYRKAYFPTSQEFQSCNLNLLLENPGSKFRSLKLFTFSQNCHYKLRKMDYIKIKLLTEAAGKYLASRKKKKKKKKKKKLFNVPHVFRVDNSHTRTALIMSFWLFCYHIWSNSWHWFILNQHSISILPENIRKPLVF